MCKKTEKWTRAAKNGISDSFPFVWEQKGPWVFGAILLASLFCLGFATPTAAAIYLAATGQATTETLFLAIPFLVSVYCALYIRQSFFFVKRVRIENGEVYFSLRSHNRQVEWREPQSAFTGVLAVMERHFDPLDDSVSSPGFSALELVHPNRNRCCEIFRTNGEADIRLAQKSACKLLQLPPMELLNGKICEVAESCFTELDYRINSAEPFPSTDKIPPELGIQRILGRLEIRIKPRRYDLWLLFGICALSLLIIIFFNNDELIASNSEKMVPIAFMTVFLIVIYSSLMSYEVLVMSAGEIEKLCGSIWLGEKLLAKINRKDVENVVVGKGKPDSKDSLIILHKFGAIAFGEGAKHASLVWLRNFFIRSNINEWSV